MTKKQILALALISVSLLPMTACGKKTKDTSKSEVSTSQKVSKEASKSKESVKSKENKTEANAETSNAQTETEANGAASREQAAEANHEKEEDSKETAKEAVANSTININQLAQGDYSSLIGTWTNPTSGDQLVITGEMVDVTHYGKLLSLGLAPNGSVRILGNGSQTIKDGTFYTAIGEFNKETEVSSFFPTTIVPAGTSLKFGDIPDESDKGRDRIISGGGQSGTATEAYYR